MPDDRDEVKDIATPAHTRRTIRQFGLHLKKSLGQNFLVDRNILHKMVDATGLNEQQGVLEIGPGIGALTQVLADAAKEVTAVEIDRRLIPVLKETMRRYPNVTIVQGDILELDLARVIAETFTSETIQVVANLPYYITTPIVLSLLERRLPITAITVMVQKEVADRMRAAPGGKDYGSLSVAVQYYCRPEWIMTVPATVFIPEPHVDSAVIRLNVYDEPPVRVPDESFFFDVVRAAFAQRRKTLFNNLASRFGDQASRTALRDILDDSGIDPGRRGETLSIQEFASLSGRLRAFVGHSPS